MRRNVTVEKLQTFMSELAARAESKGNVYFTGGATALLLGIREQTIDLDVKFDPEPRGVFQAIPNLKIGLEINVELAAPSDFIPVAADWKTKSVLIAEHGPLGFYHFDLRAQVLSKIERGYAHDLEDARAFMDRGHLTREELWSCFLRIQPELIRYPAIDPEAFSRKVKAWLLLK